MLIARTWGYDEGLRFPIIVPSFIFYIYFINVLNKQQGFGFINGRAFEELLAFLIHLIYLNIYMFMYICMCIYVYVYMYVYICLYMYIYMFVYICLCICLCIYVYIYVCVYMYIYVYIYMYVYIMYYLFSDTFCRNIAVLLINFYIIALVVGTFFVNDRRCKFIFSLINLEIEYLFHVKSFLH